MRSSILGRGLGGLAALVVVGCATTQGTQLAQDSHVITAPELRHTMAPNAYQAIERLRPEYLRTRGPSSIMSQTAMGPAVFVDRMFMGGVEVLSDLPVNEIARIVYSSAWDATTQYGHGYANGVIEVSTRRGGH
jgi:hypothetical protein